MTVTLVLARGGALGWDLPAGDDPGLAALAARYLADRRSRSVGLLAAESAWLLRRTVEPGWSCFSFWSPALTEADHPRIAAAAARTLLDPTLFATVLRTHRTRTTRQADDPSHAIDQALHTAAWPGCGCAPSPGDPTLEALETYLNRATAIHPPARLDPSARADCLASLHSPARADSLTLLDPSARVDSPARADSPTRVDSPIRFDSPARWDNGAVVDRRPWSQVAVGLRVRLQPLPSAPAAAAVLEELLGGRPEGLLARELRERRGLAYTTGALLRVEHGVLTLTLCANTTASRAAACASTLEEVLAGLDSVPPEEWRAAAGRARLSALAALEQPFAPVEESRRTRAGTPTCAEVVATANTAADQLAARPPTFDPGLARALVGAVDAITAATPVDAAATADAAGAGAPTDGVPAFRGRS